MFNIYTLCVDKRERGREGGREGGRECLRLCDSDEFMYMAGSSGKGSGKKVFYTITEYVDLIFSIPQALTVTTPGMYRIDLS